MSEQYDKVIIGAGIYGLYSALYCGRKGEKVVVIEIESDAFSRATYVNQARVHNGYHYPRSLSTAMRSSKYFNRFNDDFHFAINKDYISVYATSSKYSWTSADQFEKFCENAKIKCDPIFPSRYFKPGMCDGAFITQEYAFDPEKIKEFFLKELKKCCNVKIKYNSKIEDISQSGNKYKIFLNGGETLSTEYILNSTYASINQILNLLKFKLFNIKYEIAEIILCEVSDNIKDIGITVMDGPFFSIMPFGKTGLHSLTSVTFTPHKTSQNKLPVFKCQEGVDCSSEQLGNCNNCKNRPKSAWPYMYKLAKKYLKDDISIRYKKSLFAIKPILKSSEIDDSRPTVIRQFSSNPTFISVLSGKINTIYDLDEVL